MTFLTWKHGADFLLVLMLASAGKDCGNQKQGPIPPPTLEIRLDDPSLKAPEECGYSGSGIPSDLSLLNDDAKVRLTFIDADTLVVYRSRCHAQSQNGKGISSESRNMDAWFVNPHTGAIVSRKTWPTIKRRWLNERWDTQARILAIQDGFLVHAVNSLLVYSSRQDPETKLTLEDDPQWAAAVTPFGRTIHLQRIHRDNQAEGEWLDSHSLTILRTQKEDAGITSASDDATVDNLAKCVTLRKVGEHPRNLYCSDPSHLGLPMFLTDSEILSVYSHGFAVVSTSGEKLWGRESAVLVGRHKRSLNGNRFAIGLTGPVVYDNIVVPKNQQVIFVYDHAERTLVSSMVIGPYSEQMDFDLSPDGSMLAVYIRNTILVYKLAR